MPAKEELHEKAGGFFAVLPIVVLMLFSACASPEKPFSSDKSYEQAAAGYTFADGLSETDLPRPAREIGSFSELVYAADYLAFYRISEAVAFDVSEEYAKTFLQRVSGVYARDRRIRSGGALSGKSH